MINYAKHTYFQTGLSQVERNRFSTMKNHIRRMRAPAHSAAMPVKKSLESFCLQYTYPKCPEPQLIKGKTFTSFIAFVFNHFFLLI